MNLEEIYKLSTIINNLEVVSIRIEDMKKEFAFSLRSTITPMTKKYSEGFLDLRNAIIEGMDEAIRILQELNITVETQRDIQLLIEELKTYTPDKYLLYKPAFNDLTKILKKIEEKATIWEDRIEIELKNIPILIPYLEGKLSPIKLMGGIRNFIESDTVWNNMQNIEKEDLEDFIRCYLNKAWTPAGIMAMRAIESAMRVYYTRITKGKKITNWHNILKDLKQNYPNSDNDLIKKLEYIKDNIRNPLAHPEIRIETQEAEETLYHSLYVLNKVYG